MNQWMTQFIESYGVLAVFGLIFIENIFPPIPSEVILLFGGFFVGSGRLPFVATYIAATLGSLIGAYVLYGIGRLVDEQRIYGWARDGWMAKLGFKLKDIEMVVQKFESKGKLLVLIGRCMPIVRSLISIPAGMVHMNLLVFTLFTALGSAVWNAILIYLGMKFGENWETVLTYIDYYKYIFVAAVAVGAVIYYIHHRKKSREDSGEV
ncbi:MAG: DedA family protein [Tissierellia bacterium]|nr:DedA family protein [Tissierellia bacterium]